MNPINCQQEIVSANALSTNTSKFSSFLAGQTHPGPAGNTQVTLPRSPRLCLRFPRRGPLPGLSALTLGTRTGARNPSADAFPREDFGTAWGSEQADFRRAASSGDALHPPGHKGKSRGPGRRRLPAAPRLAPAPARIRPGGEARAVRAARSCRGDRPCRRARAPCPGRRGHAAESPGASR